MVSLRNKMMDTDKLELITSLGDNIFVGMSVKTRKEAEGLLVEFRKNYKDSLKWKELIELFEEIDVFDIRVIREWKNVMVRLEQGIINRTHKHSGTELTPDCNICIVKRALEKIKAKDETIKETVYVKKE